MTEELTKKWHLAENHDEELVTEFEFKLWRVFNGFTRWQEDCEQFVCSDPLNATELAILHIIRMKDRPKTIYELARLLNRDDASNIQYSLVKLIKIGFVEKAKTESKKKAPSYTLTEAGLKNTTLFTDARRNILIDLFRRHGLEHLKIEDVANTLTLVKGIYDEASRIAASYKSE